MAVVKNIIFDLGGVIINLNYELTEDAFVKLGIDNFKELYSQAQQTSIFDDFEKGKISEDRFCDVIRTLSRKNNTNDEIKNAWDAMLLDFPPHRLELLEKVKNKYNIFLLSNTNSIHIKAFSELIEKDYGFKKFTSLFVKTYYSSQIGLRKPDREIFDFVLNENNLNPNETIFIDDSIQHVEGAKVAGIKAYLLPKEKDIAMLVNELGLI